MTGGWFWEALGWLALALNVWGNLALTSKGASGWIIRLACNGCWIPYAVATSAWALLANHALFAAINVYGWRKWRRMQTAGETPPVPLREQERRAAFMAGWESCMKIHGANEQVRP